MITICAVLLFASVMGMAQNSSVFKTYFEKAQTFAQQYPREKVYLHFDNASYYQGDTIWYKAYVVGAVSNQPSTISKPLYVEFVDQLGHIMDRQILKLQGGEADGYISLDKNFYSGFYEVRAYTKWMEAFGEPQYFSRVLPVYRKGKTDKGDRSIALYKTDVDSMVQRPVETEKPLEVRFYPEGGQLVQGLPTAVGFETLSGDKGWVDLQGNLLSEKGDQLGTVATTHDGMGKFSYTPDKKPAKVEIAYNGKTYKFELPQAEASGCVMSVKPGKEAFEVTVSRTADVQNALAVFLFSEGTPLRFLPVNFSKGNTATLKVATKDLPAGLIQVCLINDQGATLGDRFTFVYPKDMPQIAGTADRAQYAPFQKAQLKVRLTDAKGQPVQGAALSVAVRDGNAIDYADYQNTILTDLLLTSSLKGYIDRPGFYLAEQTPERQQMLDNLLLIRGWHKYNVSDEIGTTIFRPPYLPEHQLTIYGRVHSWYEKMQPGVGISLIAENDTQKMNYNATADSQGYFSFPVNDFNGSIETYFQMQRPNKNANRHTFLYLFRHFEPSIRAYDPWETTLRWDQPKLAAGLQQPAMPTTEFYGRTLYFFFNIREFLDRQYEGGKVMATDVPHLVHFLNTDIHVEEGATENSAYEIWNTLRKMFIKYSVNGRPTTERQIHDCVDMVETAMLYFDDLGYGGNVSDRYLPKTSDRNPNLFVYIPMADKPWLVRVLPIMYCDFTITHNWRSLNGNLPMQDARHTDIVGYQTPAEFYVPTGNDESTIQYVYANRRTFYWNPSLTTDANGEAVVECYNGKNNTFLDVNAETLCNGKPATVEFRSAQ
jgi:hypothetical protein